MSRKRPPINPVGKSIFYHHDNKNIRTGMRFRITCVPTTTVSLASLVVSLEKIAPSLPRDPNQSQLSFVLDTSSSENEWLLDMIDARFSFLPNTSKDSDERRVELFSVYRVYIAPRHSTCVLATDDDIFFSATAHRQLRGGIGTIVDIEVLPA